MRASNLSQGPRIAALLIAITALACSSGGGVITLDGGAGDGDSNKGGGGLDSGFGNATGDGGSTGIVNGDFVSDDHFFINDDPPPVCQADGGMRSGAVVEGDEDCPSDKNRQGCACDTPGEVAACWPGLRASRNHGICKDGMTTCFDTEEFGTRWGPCEGYVLPQDGALRGPEACRCFSTGSWDLSNLSPCYAACDNAAECYLYSSAPGLVDGKLDCSGANSVPPQPPAEIWGTSALTMDCGGQFELCFTIKAGFASDPQDDDCVVTEQCVDVWYETAGERMELPDMPGWASSAGTCGKRFVEVSGYGEMSIQGVSRECDDVDDGEGNPLVFFRTSYCPAVCQDTPNTPDCAKCGMGGSGDF